MFITSIVYDTKMEVQWSFSTLNFSFFVTIGHTKCAFGCAREKCLNPERRFESPTPAQTQPLASPRPPPNFEKVKSASHAQTMRGWHSNHGATQTRRQRRAQRVCMVRRILINGRSFEGVFSGNHPNACIRAYPDIFVFFFGWCAPMCFNHRCSRAPSQMFNFQKRSNASIQTHPVIFVIWWKMVKKRFVFFEKSII